MNELRVGNGFDVHRLVEGRPLILGGCSIPWHLGLDGHSDADVLVHAIIDSVAGVSGLGDIGRLFPDSDDAYRGISSILLLEKMYEMLVQRNISIINIDSTIMCQEPRLAPHVDQMRKNLSAALGDLALDRITIKATTTERLGFPGRGEGIAAMSTAMVQIG